MKKTAKKTPAKKTPAKKTPAKKAPAKKTPAKKTPAKKTPAKKAPAKKAKESVAAKSGTRKSTAAKASASGDSAAAEAAPAQDAPAAEAKPGSRLVKGAKTTGKRPKKGRKRAARFEDVDSDLHKKKKKRARLEKMRRAGAFGVPGRPTRAKRRKSRDELVRPSPPLEKTDPLKHYLAGEMVPCPVGCGGFSEVVRVSTMENGAGEIWFECLSCAQRRMFELDPAMPNERKQIAAEIEAGQEPHCPRHTKSVQLRRRGRDYVCPECGVAFPEP